MTGLAALGAATLRTRHLLGEADDLGIGCEPSSPGGGLLTGSLSPLGSRLGSRLVLRCGRCRTPLRLALLVRCVRCRMPLRLALLVLPARLDPPRAGIARGARCAAVLPPCRRFGREEHLPVDGVDERRQRVVLAVEAGAP